MMGKIGSVTRVLCSVLAVTLLALACGKDSEVSLAELAHGADEPVVQLPRAVSGEDTAPIATVVIHGGADWAKLAIPVLSLLADIDEKKLADNGVYPERIPPSACIELQGIGIELSPDDMSPRPESVTGGLLLHPTAGQEVAAQANAWQQILDSYLTQLQIKSKALCSVAQSRVFCTLEPIEERAALLAPSLDVEGFRARCQSALSTATSSGTLSVKLNIPPLLNLLERFLGTVVLWAVLPEDLARIDSVTMFAGRDPDLLTVEVKGSGSALMGELAEIFRPSQRDVQLPASSPFLVFTGLDDVENRLDRLAEIWSGKALITSVLRPKRDLLHHSWETQLAQLASGLVGVLAVGKIDPSQLSSNLVFFVQPTDRKVFSKRLEYIFSGRTFKIETEQLRTGDSVTRAIKRGKKPLTERLAWLQKDGTFFISLSSNTLRQFSEELFQMPHGKPREYFFARLEPSENLYASVSIRKLVSRLTVPDGEGVGFGMALTILKNATASIDKEILVRFIETADGDRVSTLSFRVENSLSALESLLTSLKPFMGFVSGK